MRDALIASEQYVLRTLSFDLTVDLPYSYLLNYIKSLGGKSDLSQVAWNIVNDSLATTICLEYKPHTIACASIYLASKILGIFESLPIGKKQWWTAFDTTLEEIEDIGKRVLELYEVGSPDNLKDQLA
eukprot:TRINITY_DN14284_c0_g1_i1.p1 TRINITY_DN14284_c0_g1~~TRINITY_DN14284_c0_g1_i1.p1  ORF type:complete len:142 (-),score=25.58 TRINITY_DN14284_c0_g1_i1:63-446(-)